MRYQLTCRTLSILACLCVLVISPSCYGKTQKSQVTDVPNDPSLMEYYDFQNTGPVVENKAPQPDTKQANGWFPQTWHYLGHSAGRKAVYFSMGSFIVTSSKSLGLKDAITIEAWIEPVDNRKNCVLYSDWNTAGNNRSFELSLARGKVAFKISPDGKKQMGFIGNRVLDIKKWHQVVVTFDRGLMKSYVDGTLDESLRDDSVTSIFNPQDGKKCCIGQNNTDPKGSTYSKRLMYGLNVDNGYVGLMDELAVYTRALSAKEVSEHYQVGKPAKGQTMREVPIYNGQDQMAMAPSFFKGLFPETQPVEMKAGEHFQFYDKALPADRSDSFWGLNMTNGSVKGWKKYTSEKSVYDALLRDIGPPGQKQWEIGIGKAGQLYSWRGPWGEAVPPQFMPWTDEVWQAASLSFEIQNLSVRLNSLGSGAIGNGYYQAGATSCQYPPVSDTFYSPVLARWFDAKDNAYYVLNWYLAPSSPTLFKHEMFIYTRYKYLGDGVLEVTTAAFDADHYTYGRRGIPWGGVRTSTYPYIFVSKPDGSYAFRDQMFAENGSAFDRSQADGWLGTATSKDDPNAQAFGFVFGRPSNQFKGGAKLGGGIIDVGTAGEAIVKDGDQITVNKRDYTVMDSNLNGDQLPGQAFCVNYYLIVGSRDQVIQNARKYAGRVYTADLHFTEQNAGLTPLYLDAKGLLTRQERGNSKPPCQAYNMPITNSQRLFRISEVPANGKSIITTDPYALSYKSPWVNVLPKNDPLYKRFSNRYTILPHLSQEAKPLHWTLLGFVIPADKIALNKSQYTAVPGINTTENEPPVLARK